MIVLTGLKYVVGTKNEIGNNLMAVAFFLNCG
jgi:hypothetical protein